METQPPEVLRLIFNLLDKWTLKHCRLVCKTLEEFSSPLLFKKIVISPDRARLDLAERVVGRFSSHLTTLVVRPATHRKLTLKEYTKEAKTLFEETKAQNCHDEQSLRQAFKAHLRLFYDLYEKKREEEENLYNSGEFVVYLCSTLSKAKNLRKLIIGEPENLYDRPGFDRNELCVGDFDDCILHHEECLPGPLSDRWPCVLDLLHPAILALGKFGSAITEIDMEYVNDDDIAGKGTFDAIIRGCKFPKLTSLILEGLDPEGDKLEEFLLASPKLEYLFLHSIKVISGD